MSHLKDALKAASELNSSELKQLQAAIAQMDRAKRLEKFDLKDFSIGLVRLDDTEYVKERKCSLAISEDGWFLMSLFRRKEGETPPLNFAELHYVLETMYGKSGAYFDDWKGTFSFPFALTIIKGDRKYDYLMNVASFRSMAEFSLRKIVDCDRVDGIVHPPFEEEFSRNEINYFLAYFIGYLKGCLIGLKKSGSQPSPFVYRIGSNLILYGFMEGEFFEEEYDSESECDTEFNGIRLRISEMS